MTGGGRFAFIANGSISASTKRGQQRICRCHRFRKFPLTGKEGKLSLIYMTVLSPSELKNV